MSEISVVLVLLISICLACGKTLEGRSDKKFCDVYCKSAFHYQQSRNNAENIYHKVDRQLKKNRRLLKSYNKAGKATVRAQILIDQGFHLPIIGKRKLGMYTYSSGCSVTF